MRLETRWLSPHLLILLILLTCACLQSHVLAGGGLPHWLQNPVSARRTRRLTLQRQACELVDLMSRAVIRDIQSAIRLRSLTLVPPRCGVHRSMAIDDGICTFPWLRTTRILQMSATQRCSHELSPAKHAIPSIDRCTGTKKLHAGRVPLHHVV